MYDIEFRDHKASEYMLHIERRPDIPTPEPVYTAYTVSGRDGELLEHDGTYKDTEIKVRMNYINRKTFWGRSFRLTKAWLLGGTGKLKLSDDPDIFYKVKHVSIEANERRVRESGELPVAFLCDPYTYMESGLIPHSISEASYNPGVLAKPTYRLKGEGRCQLQVDGKALYAEVGQNLTIDTDRMIAYREDGTLNNIALTGDYEDLYLKPGENRIGISDGFDIEIIPNWRFL